VNFEPTTTDEYERARLVTTRELPVTHDIAMPGYTITISPGIVESAGVLIHAAARTHRYAIIADIAVAARFGGRLLGSFAPGQAQLFTVGSGEAYKTRQSWARLTDEIADAGYGRDTAIVSLGGGVTGDLAGFVAATFMRGIPVAHVPTTLLAMIDASIGGKTGVDTPAGKNMVGAFHPPCAVIVDPLLLISLPAPDRRAGLAEALKHGVIADTVYFERVATLAPKLIAAGAEGMTAMVETVARAIAIKCDVVRRDEREQGLRQVLNFGHTIGHAVELVSNYSIAHGEAVAIGMVIEARIAERLGVAESGTADRITTALAGAGLPTAVPSELAPGAIVSATRSDKKARAGAVRYALPSRIGAMAGERDGWSIAVNDTVVHAALGVRHN